MIPGLVAIVLVLVLIGLTVFSSVSQGHTREAGDLVGAPRSHVTIVPVPYDREREGDDDVSSS